MATETEIKLSLSPRAASRLARHPLLSPIEPQRVLLVNIYYDTPDRRLQRERVVVRHRRKGREWLMTVKTVSTVSAGLAQRSEWEVPGQRGEFEFSQVDDERVRSVLEAARDQLQISGSRRKPGWHVRPAQRSFWLRFPDVGIPAG